MTEEENYTYDDISAKKLIEVVKTFKSKQNIDIINGSLRSINRDKIQKIKIDKDVMYSDIPLFVKCKDNRKQVEVKNISVEALGNPFEMSNIKILSSVQQAVVQHARMLSTFGSYAYSCSCGSGKTLAGVYVMHYLSCKTLIISSRNAVNDQWRMTLQTLYPELKICTRLHPVEDPDVWIYSPQYLINKIDIIDIHPSLIIYDEVHSLMSAVFIRVLLFPMVKVIRDEWSELPYMIALTATLHPKNSREYRDLTRIFGQPFMFDSSITNIPVNVYDYRDHYTRTEKNGNVIEYPDSLGFLDSKYKPLGDVESLKYFCNMVEENNDIDVHSVDYKGIIMTYTIASSVYAALYVHHKWNVNVLLIRAVDEPSIYIKKDEYLDYEFNESVDVKTIVNDKIGVKCVYEKYLNDASIIVGTVHRLKEGFSVQNITWGICTQFIYGLIPRVQLLGRIRRSSTNEELNNKKRILYVCSGKKPSNLATYKRFKGYKQDPKYMYDDASEGITFERENYVRE